MPEQLLISIPSDDVSTVLDALEDYVESVQDGGCDCDTCTRELEVMDALVKCILSAKQVKQTKKEG